MIVDPKTTGIYNSIDPDFFEDGGVKYLFWGSLGHNSGIWGARLAPDGLSLAKDSVPVKLAGDDMEGTYVHKHGKYYYLFASEGFCCNKESSSYRIVVGRSLNPLGPYSGKSGMSMISEKGDYDGVIMNKCPDLSFVGPGHDSEIITDDKGDDWMLYHVYWKGNGYNGRLLAMDRVLWGKDGWPYFAGEHPSSTSVAPVFR
jgi:arabinan endo-1,5-alpha-L-arabinosidase